MKVIQLMGGYSDGGAEIFYIDALTALKNSNIEQYAIVNKKNKKGINKLKELSIPFMAVSFNKLFKCEKNARTIIFVQIKSSQNFRILMNWELADFLKPWDLKK